MDVGLLAVLVLGVGPPSIGPGAGPPGSDPAPRAARRIRAALVDAPASPRTEALRRLLAALQSEAPSISVQTRLAGRWLYVMPRDPTDHVDRVELVFRRGEVARFLRPGFWEKDQVGFRVPPDWPAEGTLQVRLRSTLLSPPVTVAGCTVIPDRQPPQAPPLPASGSKPPDPRVDRPSRRLPWWFWAASAAVATGVGLGVWQESR